MVIPRFFTLSSIVQLLRSVTYVIGIFTLTCFSLLHSAVAENIGSTASDPISRLAEWGYPLGSFESGEALFLKAHSDQQIRVMRAALDANIRLSPNILAHREMPDAIWPDLIAHRNWGFGQGICEAIGNGTSDILNIWENQSGNYSALLRACPREISQEYEEELVILEQRLIEEEKKASEIKRKRKKLENSLAREISKCRSFYLSEAFIVDMEAALAKYINSNGDYWNPPVYKLSIEFRNIIRDKSTLDSTNFAWFLGPVRGGKVGVYPNGKLMIVNANWRHKSIDEYFSSAMIEIEEQGCQFSLWADEFSPADQGPLESFGALFGDNGLFAK